MPVTNLLVDLGNTSIRWAWLEGGSLTGSDRRSRGDSDVGAVLDAMQGAGRRPAAAFVASVAPAAETLAAVAGLRDRFRVPVLVAETERSAGGVRNGYEDAAQLGVDRWLAMIAARALHDTALCVVDAGTALTIDVLDREGIHQGGLIIPGPALMQQSLLRDTARIAAASALRGNRPSLAGGPWGRDTQGCIARGGLRACACLVEDCMRILAVDGVSDAVLVMTGGDAEALQQGLSVPAELRPLLVLEGLAWRYCGGLPGFRSDGSRPPLAGK